MEKDECVEEQENSVVLVALPKEHMASPYRYTKEKLLEIKELPCSNERPECLSEKYDSDGVWDPEKWHASLYSSSERASPVDGYKKDYSDDRVPLKRRFADPRERLKEDDLDVVLSPQRRSFGGGCQGNAVPAHQSRQAVSPLENKENESLRLVGARRIGSGRIMAARAFERDARADKDVRERERDFKDKRFRRDFSDKRVFSERRRNESYTEEEPEWFSGGPTSQSETIELIGFDDKVLQEDKPRPKRSRKRSESVKEAVECNGDLVEDVELDKEPGVDRVAMQSEVQAEPATGDFDFNEFFNLEKTMPGLASQPPPDLPLSLPEAQVSPAQRKNILQELLGPQGPPRGTSPTLLSNLLGSADPGSSLLRQGAPSPSLYPRRTPSPDYYPGRVQPSTGFVVGPQPLLPEPFTELHRPLSPGPTTQQMRGHSMGVDPATLEALTVQQDLALHAHQLYQQGFSKLSQEKLFRNSRPPRMNRSPIPGGHRAGSSSPGCTVTSMLSPSFTPTSVIRKMYESKEKSRDEPSSRPESKENVLRSQEVSSTTPDSFLEGAEDRSSPATGGKPTFPRSACSTPLSGQARNSKDPERSHQNTSGHHTPTVVSPGPASPFPRPVYQVPLLSHVPLVRPPPPQLHPSVVQRMLAQGLQPQQLPPALLQAGVFPQGVDLSQVQGLPPGLLGQPFYTVGAAGHPLLPRAGNPMQLAVLQQQLQQQRAVPGAPHLPSSVSQSHGMQRTAHSQRRGGSPPLGLAKWFGTDVLQQPLPSMPAKVISVDELEFRQ
ncbi:eukaryotic translation initiation factor 4E transporter isoform X7 [Scleropages formosus]|uniref:eukaryotic translation initiation factor 4E transporter isoform X7 n=1 Tax=Scleropages formosus TaxID=113540 RepID=UPI0010FABCBE|nr:eukaryotic translation initiation factor 4E transporter isoform X7 [Scleropages formosus]